MTYLDHLTDAELAELERLRVERVRISRQIVAIRERGKKRMQRSLR